MLDKEFAEEEEPSEELLTSHKKRVRFMPHIEEIISAVNVSPSNSLESVNVSTDCKSELETCLKRLQTDANDILLSSGNFQNRSALAVLQMFVLL